MLSKKSKKMFVLYLTFSFLFMILFSPASSFAKWDDKSDELPGTSDNSDIIVIAVVGVVIIVAVLIYYSAKKKAAKTKEEKTKEEDAKINKINEIKISSVSSSDDSNTHGDIVPVVAYNDSL